MRDTIARTLSAIAVAFALAALMAVLLSPRPFPAPLARASAEPRRQVALDCNRPQGHHRWVADMITPPTTADDGTVVRLSTKDAQGNTDTTELDIKGWLCVIDAEYPKVP